MHLDKKVKRKPNKLKHGHIIVKSSAVHGYGVFAKRNIQKDSIIEECPLLIFDNNEATRATIDYLFEYKNDETCALALGYGSLYNHAISSNATHYFDQDYDIMGIKAIRNIRRGEEIFISYSESWFKGRGIEIKSPQKPSTLARILKLIGVVVLLLVLSLIVFILRSRQ